MNQDIVLRRTRSDLRSGLSPGSGKTDLRGLVRSTVGGIRESLVRVSVGSLFRSIQTVTYVLNMCRLWSRAHAASTACMLKNSTRYVYQVCQYENIMNPKDSYLCHPRRHYRFDGKDVSARLYNPHYAIQIQSWLMKGQIDDRVVLLYEVLKVDQLNQNEVKLMLSDKRVYLQNLKQQCRL